MVAGLACIYLATRARRRHGRRDSIVRRGRPHGPPLRQLGPAEAGPHIQIRSKSLVYFADAAGAAKTLAAAPWVAFTQGAGHAPRYESVSGGSALAEDQETWENHPRCALTGVRWEERWRLFRRMSEAGSHDGRSVNWATGPS